MKLKLIVISILLISTITACKKEEKKEDIFATVDVPKKVEVVKPTPKPIEPIKTVAPTPTIAEPIKTVPIAEIKPPEPIKVEVKPTIQEVKVIKSEIQAPVIETKPIVATQPETIKPIVKTPSIKKPKKQEVIYSIEFE